MWSTCLCLAFVVSQRKKEKRSLLNVFPWKEKKKVHMNGLVATHIFTHFYPRHAIITQHHTSFSCLAFNLHPLYLPPQRLCIGDSVSTAFPPDWHAVCCDSLHRIPCLYSVHDEASRCVGVKKKGEKKEAVSFITHKGQPNNSMGSL